MSGGCPSELELDRALGTGDPAIATHLERCDACRAIWDDTLQAIALARDLPIALPRAHHLQDQRTALLATSPTSVTPIRPARRLRWIAPGVALVAVVAIAVVPRDPPPAPVEIGHATRGSVHPHEGAQFTLASEPPDEIVRLRDGVIDIDVDPLAAGERFRVVVGADQVEVRGTSFQVTASSDQLIAVHVVHGRVEVRRSNAPVVVLRGGESWHVTITASLPPPPPPPPPPAPRPSPRVLTAPSPAPAAPKTTDPQEVAFVRGWDAMRDGDLGQAAAAFNRAIALAPEGPLAEDATFWYAVAVARLHRAADAISAFRSFLDVYPKSPRASEASAMLGWLLVDGHELDEARRRFDAALKDPNAQASTQASARRGLDVLNK